MPKHLTLSFNFNVTATNVPSCSARWFVARSNGRSVRRMPPNLGIDRSTVHLESVGEQG